MIPIHMIVVFSVYSVIYNIYNIHMDTIVKQPTTVMTLSFIITS